MKNHMGAKTSDAEEFTNVPLRQGRSHVLQRDIGVDKVYGRISQYCEVGRDIVHVFTSPWKPVELSSRVNHGRRDINSNDSVEMDGEGLTQSADAASEIKRLFSRRQRMNGFDVVHSSINLADSGLKKFFSVPTSVPFFRMREDGPKRIALTEEIPVLLKLTKIQS